MLKWLRLVGAALLLAAVLLVMLEVGLARFGGPGFWGGGESSAARYTRMAIVLSAAAWVAWQGGLWLRRLYFGGGPPAVETSAIQDAVAPPSPLPLLGLSLGLVVLSFFGHWTLAAWVAILLVPAIVWTLAATRSSAARGRRLSFHKQAGMLLSTLFVTPACVVALGAVALLAGAAVAWPLSVLAGQDMASNGPAMMTIWALAAVAALVAVGAAGRLLRGWLRWRWREHTASV